MQASYLRVKNHTKHQHYDPTKRRPPWIKLYNDLLGGDVGGFDELSEAEQWQLVRIWLVASKSSVLTHDENGKVVPVVANDEKSLRRSIMSLKRIPLEKFIREGWLIPVAEDELILPSDLPKDGQDASADASTALAPPIGPEVQRVRGLETSSSTALSAGLMTIEEGMKRLIIATGGRSREDIDKITRTVVANKCGPAAIKLAIAAATGPGVRDPLAVALSELKKRRAA